MINNGITWCGVITHLHITPRGSLPMKGFESLNLIAGIGIEGDRYASEEGFYSDRPEAGRQITLFEIEALEAIKRDYDIDFEPHEHRRNVTLRGVPLNHLVGKQFRLGQAVLEATRLSTPCRHIEEVTGKEVFNPMLHRSGLNCMIIESAIVKVGDQVMPL